MTQVTFNIRKDNWKQILKDSLSDFVLTREVKCCLEFRYKNSKLTFRKESGHFQCSSIKYSSLENDIFTFLLDEYKTACDIKFEKKMDTISFQNAWTFKFNMFEIELNARISEIVPVENLRLYDSNLYFDLFGRNYSFRVMPFKQDLDADLLNIEITPITDQILVFNRKYLRLYNFLEFLKSESFQEKLKLISENRDKEKELLSEIDQLKKDLYWRESELSQIHTRKKTLMDF